MTPFGHIPPTVCLGCPKTLWGELHQPVFVALLSLDNGHLSPPTASMLLHHGCKRMNLFFISNGYPVEQPLWHDSRTWSLSPRPLGSLLCSSSNNFETHVAQIFHMPRRTWMISTNALCGRVSQATSRKYRSIQVHLCIRFPRLKLVPYWSNLPWSHSVMLSVVHPQFLYDCLGTQDTIYWQSHALWIAIHFHYFCIDVTDCITLHNEIADNSSMFKWVEVFPSLTQCNAWLWNFAQTFVWLYRLRSVTSFTWQKNLGITF